MSHRSTRGSTSPQTYARRTVLTAVGSLSVGSLSASIASATSEREQREKRHTRTNASPGTMTPPSHNWTQFYGEPNRRDNAEAVIAMPDKGLVIAGSAHSNPWLFKTDATGDLQWTRTYTANPGYDNAANVIQTTDGGFVLVGATRTPDEDDRAVLVVHTDATGKKQWRQRYSFDRKAGGTDLVQTPDGGYLIVGTWAIIEQAMALRIDEEGTEVWRQTYGRQQDNGEPYEEAAEAVVPAPDGGYLIVGTVWFDDNKQDLYLVQIDDAGRVQWSRDLDISIRDRAMDIVRTDDGYTLAGRACGNGSDGVLVHLTTEGEIDWRRAYDATTDNDEFNALSRTADGGYLMGGSTEDAGFWLVKTDATGTHEWTRTRSLREFSWLTDVAQTADGQYVAIGNARRDGTSPGTSDAAISTYTPPA